MGRLRIKKELLSKGIAKSLIEENREYNAIDESSLIEKMLDTKLSHYDLKDGAHLRRVLGYLSRRGFGYGSINSAIAKRRGDFSP
jgi:SOS response regulatory protein OraA/RecX